jgi:hypothetical protein
MIAMTKLPFVTSPCRIDLIATSDEDTMFPTTRDMSERDGLLVTDEGLERDEVGLVVMIPFIEWEILWFTETKLTVLISTTDITNTINCNETRVTPTCYNMFHLYCWLEITKGVSQIRGRGSGSCGDIIEDVLSIDERVVFSQ